MRTAVLGFWSFVFAIFTGATVAADVSRPNVVILLADDLGWGDVGFHGGPIETPGIDRIAREGVELNRFYATPICTPTRTALMTGRDPIRQGMAYSVVLPWYPGSVPLDEHFMPQSFKAAGYQTAMIGKWHLGHTIPQHHPNARGFDYFFGHLHTAPDYWSHEVQYGLDLQRNGESVQAEGEYATHVAGSEVTDWLENRRDPDKPFFLYVPFVAPHSPMQAPQALVEKYRDIPNESRPASQPAGFRPIYAGMVHAMDEVIVNILDHLDRLGLAQNTIVLFFSDNGGSSANGSYNAELRGWKGQTYEGGIRVTAALRWPAGLEGGQVNNQLMSVLDVFPSLATAAGIPLGNGKPLDGIDQWSAIADNSSDNRRRDLFFITEIPIADYIYTGVISGGWKLVQTVDQLLETTTVNNELFNLDNDLGEKNNLADKHPKRVAELAEKIHQWRQLHPVAGVRTTLTPPPGWRPPLDWANAMRANGAQVNAGLERNQLGTGVEQRGIEMMRGLDRAYGERGRLVYP